MSWLRRMIVRSLTWLRSFEPFTVPPPTLTEEDVAPQPTITSPLPKFVHVVGLDNYNAETAASWLMSYAITTARAVFVTSEFVAFVTAHSSRAEQVKVQTGLLVLKHLGYLIGDVGVNSEGLLIISPRLFNFLEKRQPGEVIEMGDGDGMEEV